MKNKRSRIIVYGVLLIFLLPAAFTVEANDQTERPFRRFKTINLDDPDPLFKQIQSRIQNVTNFRAEFTEKKDLDALSRTIQNSGYVLFSRDRGLFRFVQKPFQNRQLITKDGLVVESTPKETRRKKLKPGSPPRQFLDALYMVFSGNFSDFKNLFRTELKIRKKSGEKHSRTHHWTLRLQPGEASMKKFFSQMIIKGRGKHLTSFSLHRDNGDTTRTTFRNHSYPDKLSDEQVEQFRSLQNK